MRADRLELLREPGVAGEEDLAALRLDHERRPERRVAIVRRAPGEVLRRRGGESQTADRHRLVPVELVYERVRHAVPREVRTDAERGDDRHLLLCERFDRAAAEVIVVIVREHDGIERRQLVDRRRHRMKALRPGEAHRRDALAEDGIGEHALSVELEQHRAVPEPRHAEAGVRAAKPVCVRTLDGKRTRWVPHRVSEEVLAEQRQRAAPERRADPRGIPEDSVDELRRGVHALAAHAVPPLRIIHRHRGSLAASRQPAAPCFASRCPSQARSRPAVATIATPASEVVVGTSPKIAKPRSPAHASCV